MAASQAAALTTMLEYLSDAKQDTAATPKKYMPMNSTTARVTYERCAEAVRSCEYKQAAGKARREEPAPMANWEITTDA